MGPRRKPIKGPPRLSNRNCGGYGKTRDTFGSFKVALPDGRVD
jgi:hypothetical protein